MRFHKRGEVWRRNIKYMDGRYVCYRCTRVVKGVQYSSERRFSYGIETRRAMAYTLREMRYGMNRYIKELHGDTKE